MAARTYCNPDIPPRALEVLRAASGTVLDVGGGIAPWFRATHVIDRRPFDPRRLAANAWGHDGREPSDWSRTAYVVHDLCSEEPWPFEDGSIDLGLCSHTLEDLPRPLPAVRELARVCRRVLVVCPSRLVEHTLHLVRPGHCGWHHHHWMVTVKGDEIAFVAKSETQLRPGCHVVCPINHTLDSGLSSVCYHGEQPRGRIRRFPSVEEERRENRAFLLPYLVRSDLFRRRPHRMTWREWSWHVRARLLVRVPGPWRRYYQDVAEPEVEPPVRRTDVMVTPIDTAP